MVWSDNFNITKTKTSKGNSGRAPLAEERCLLPACEHKLPTISQLGRSAVFQFCSIVLLPSTQTHLSFISLRFRLTASYQMSAKGTKPFSRDRLINLMASIRKKKTGRTRRCKKLFYLANLPLLLFICNRECSTLNKQKQTKNTSP